MRRIRVLIADVPQIVYELLRAQVEAYDDMEVVGPCTTRATLNGDIAATGADVVILEPMQSKPVAECRDLLYAFPRVGALAMPPHRRNAALYELRLHETVLGEASPAEFIAAIHAQCVARVEYDAAP